MKRLNLYLTMLALLFSFGFANAQSAKAEQILEASKDKFEKLDDVQASVVYTLSNPNMPKPIVKKGSLMLKGKKFAVRFSDESIISDTKYVWVLLNSDEEVTVTDYDEDGIGIDRVFKVYDSDFKPRYDGESNGLHKITLFSEKGSSDLFKTEVWIGKSDKMPAKLIMYARNGTTYSYELSNIRTNTGLTDSKFRVNTNSLEDDGWIVTDLTED